MIVPESTLRPCR